MFNSMGIHQEAERWQKPSVGGASICDQDLFLQFFCYGHDQRLNMKLSKYPTTFTQSRRRRRPDEARTRLPYDQGLCFESLMDFPLNSRPDYMGRKLQYPTTPLAAENAAWSPRYSTAW